MTDFVVFNGKGLRIVDVSDMDDDINPNTIVAEVIAYGRDDLLLTLRNPLAGPQDFWWPLNMFSGPRVRLSALRSSNFQWFPINLTI